MTQNNPICQPAKNTSEIDGAKCASAVASLLAALNAPNHTAAVTAFIIVWRIAGRSFDEALTLVKIRYGGVK